VRALDNSLYAMQTKKTVSGRELSWLGMGSYGIGGKGHRDKELTEKKPDNVYIEALKYAFELGYNFTEIALGYGHGNSSRLFSEAMQVSKTSKDDLFITNSVYPRDFNSFDEVKKDINEMYDVFKTDFFDSTLVTQSLAVIYGYDKVVEFLHELLKSERTRFVSLSNGSVKFIRKFFKEFGDKFFAHETHLSFEVRINKEEGIFDICKSLGVENIIWRPLRRNLTVANSWKLLSDLAKKYEKSENQIVLNWMYNQGLRPMVMSSSKKHIEDNWNAKDFKMETADYQAIDEFQVPNFKVPEIDWEKEKIGEKGKSMGMAEFCITFDELYTESKHKK